jgi:hypothetical protein
MALDRDTPIVQELGPIGEYPVALEARIFEGAAVGKDDGTGFARPLEAGDLFLGFSESQADNRTGESGGEINVRTVQRGKRELAISGLAATDLGADVYASDDGTFTLTPGSNSFVGNVIRYVSSGVGVVTYEAVLKQGSDTGS